MTIETIGPGHRLESEVHPDTVLTETTAWTLIRALRRRVQALGPITRPLGLQLGGDDELVEVGPEDARVVARPERPHLWARTGGAEARPLRWTEIDHKARDLLDLYLPLCLGARAENLIVAHLAQSLDGRVATKSGMSQFISGREDLVHTHRMRALFDAVLVGARTVEHDDPQLTTRLASGDNPVRVIVDPHGRLGPEHRVFRDGQAPTVVIRCPGGPRPDGERTSVIELPCSGGWIPVADIVAALRERRLKRIFVEGGGITVSGFLREKFLHRLQVTVAPMIIGSGRPAFALDEVDDLGAALQLDCRHFALGRDILFDCALADR